MIALKQPSLNEQLDFNKLILFRNGVTLRIAFPNLLIYLLLQTFIVFISDDLISVHTL